MEHKIIRADGVTELSQIKSVTTRQKVNTGVDLHPGCVSSAQIEVEVFGSATDAPISGEALTCYEVDNEGNETLIGTFYARPAISTRATYRFTAYDALIKADADFSARLHDIQDSFPMTLGDIVDEALTVAGLTLSGTFPMSDMTVNAFLVDGLTCRDILSYAAELACRFVRCDENGNVVFDWYKDAENVTRSYVTDWKQGDISATTGGDISNTTRCRTSGVYNFDDAIGNVTVTIASGFRLIDREYSGTPATTSNYLGTFWGDWTETEIAFTPTAGHYYRFAISKTDNSAIAPSDIPDDAITLSYVTSHYRIYPTSGSSGTETYVAYKEDGLNYENYEANNIEHVAVHSSDNEQLACVYPTDGTRTVSGYMLSITDAVDTALEDLVINIPYTPEQKYAIHVDVTGKNLLKTENFFGGDPNVAFYDGITFTRLADGTFTIVGTSTETHAYGTNLELALFYVPNGMETFIFNGNPLGTTATGSAANYYTILHMRADNQTILDTVYIRTDGDSVVTIPDGTTNISVRFFIGPGETIDAVYRPMIRMNASDGPDFEPFGTRYSIRWLPSVSVSTIYGGTYNPVTGELVSMYNADGTEKTPTTSHFTSVLVEMRKGLTNVLSSGGYDDVYSFPTGTITATYYSSSAYSGNVMHIRNNMLLSGADYDTTMNVAQNVYANMRSMGAYRPATISLFPMNAPFSAGEIVNVTDSQGVSFRTPVMEKTVAENTITLQSTGNETYNSTSSDFSKAILNLAENVIRMNKVKIDSADIDEAIINYLQANYLKIIGYLVSGDYLTRESLVVKLADGLLQFYRGDNTYLYSMLGLNQLDATDPKMHFSATDDGDGISIDFYDGAGYTKAYEADFSPRFRSPADLDTPVNTMYNGIAMDGATCIISDLNNAAAGKVQIIALDASTLHTPLANATGMVISSIEATGQAGVQEAWIDGSATKYVRYLTGGAWGPWSIAYYTKTETDAAFVAKRFFDLETLTSQYTLTKSTGNSTFSEFAVRRIGNIIYVTFDVRTTAAISAGSNVMTGTITGPYMPPFTFSFNIGSYLASTAVVSHITDTGGFTLRCVGATLASGSTIHVNMTFPIVNS